MSVAATRARCPQLARPRPSGGRRSCAIWRNTAAGTTLRAGCSQTLGRPRGLPLTNGARKYRQKSPSNAKKGIGLTEDRPQEYAYLRLPPHEELRSCAGLVLAGMAARARVGVGGLEEAVGFWRASTPTTLRPASASPWPA